MSLLLSVAVFLSRVSLASDLPPQKILDWPKVVHCDAQRMTGRFKSSILRIETQMNETPLIVVTGFAPDSDASFVIGRTQGLARGEYKFTARPGGYFSEFRFIEEPGNEDTPQSFISYDDTTKGYLNYCHEVRKQSRPPYAVEPASNCFRLSNCMEH